ncbi:GRIP and coiled-coil domain-containing protein 2-like [Saccoglossus kowalevskii]
MWRERFERVQMEQQTAKYENKEAMKHLALQHENLLESVKGMEHPDLESAHVPHTPIPTSPSMLPLDQLLTTGDDKQSVASVSTSAEEEQLKHQLILALKKLEHFSEITNDNEATIMRLTEQAKVLKGEIRRLERNQERDKSVSNLEYLKNVTMKFITLQPCDEKRQLIPVLNTMLRLSEEENEKLCAAAEVESSGQSSGWGGYLPRWSGAVS